jgi:hypothetical protein
VKTEEGWNVVIKGHNKIILTRRRDACLWTASLPSKLEDEDNLALQEFHKKKPGAAML